MQNHEFRTAQVQEQKLTKEESFAMDILNTLLSDFSAFERKKVIQILDSNCEERKLAEIDGLQMEVEQLQKKIAFLKEL